MSSETFDTLSSNDTPAISNLNNFTTNTHSILDKLNFSKKLNKHNLSRSMQFSNIIYSRNKFTKHRSHSTHHSVSFSTTASCLNITSLLKEIDSLSKKTSSLYNQLKQKNKEINELTISNKQKENQHLIEIIKNDMKKYKPTSNEFIILDKFFKSFNGKVGDFISWGGKEKVNKIIAEEGIKV